eukprot:11178699-Ditylum_brightwellii.AAC.1
MCDYSARGRGRLAGYRMFVTKLVAWKNIRFQFESRDRTPRLATVGRDTCMSHAAGRMRVAVSGKY